MRLYIIHTYMPIYKFPFRKFNCTLVVYMLNQVYLKAASHDGQKLVIRRITETVILRPFTPIIRTRKKVIIFPLTFDAGARSQMTTCQCQCKIVLKYFLKQLEGKYTEWPNPQIRGENRQSGLTD